ncbi:hypothetical protein ACJRO7_031198 [Eucalyptus globulus]|uniref:Uncharacterized protein n=1 Tax=Eucalyptus globulus TaxID=34317 RepID=A0ABD3JE04_EUCGL
METPKVLVARKTLYHNFIPTKAEEEAAKARNVPHQVTRTVIETNNFGLPQLFPDPNYPWLIRKAVSDSEITTGKLVLSHDDTFGHVFPYWTGEMCNHVEKGGRYLVALVDFTDEKSPKRYQSEHTFLERGMMETYLLGWLDIVHNRRLIRDEIKTEEVRLFWEVLLFWDVRSGSFYFKILRRHS